MGKNPRSGSFEIALSAVSCAVAVAFLSLGVLSGVFLALGYCAGVVAMMVPLSCRFFRGGFLAYVGTCILALVLGAAAKFWDLVPFVLFFGIHPLLNALQVRLRVNKWLAFIVKAAWFDGTLIAAYFLLFGGVVGGALLPQAFYDILNRYLYLLVFTVGTALFFVYDYLIFKCQIAVNLLIYRIRK